VPNIEGRVAPGGVVAPGLYVVGWIKRGPTGVIGTNKPDSQQTVELLIDDIARLNPCANPDSGTVLKFLNSRGVTLVTFADWQRIDALEVERGKVLGKPREKIVRRADLLAAVSDIGATN
jgi:ferredoxin--NADP+ reductase